MRLAVGCVLLLCVTATFADVYMHNPRGSNNRLNEQSAERQNANRVFDSQNNNRGGYNVGDSTDQASNNEAQQYRMKYFQSAAFKTFTGEGGALTGEAQSMMMVEWTNQHGCGGSENTDPKKMNCNMVLQYMCQEDVDDATGTANTLRNGRETTTQNYNQLNNLDESANQAANRKQNSVSQQRVLQEPWEFYDNCYARERNAGLFTADQELQNNNLGYSSAIYTRQNPNGNRRGYECPEERDYYPYWHPSPWKDMAILVGNLSQCEYFQSESFNVQAKYECLEYFSNGQRQHYSRYNNQQDCEDNDGEWTPFYNYLEKATTFTTEAQCNNADGTDGVRYVWGIPIGEDTEQCLVGLDAPDCEAAPWTRDNHLGNTREGNASRYMWTVPYFPSQLNQRCAMRIRYNISTDDYDPLNINASSNQNLYTGVQSPVQQNPYVDIGADHVPLRLAINTAQYGRTFEDRSHVFKLMKRPASAGMDAARIMNLNVRGKRGNIVQVYPAVEYDFMPNKLEINEGDMVHIQWTGSNTHNNGNPGGDGQTGDAGEGRGGTDRSNIVQIPNALDNYPLPFEQSTMWTGAKVHWIAFQDTPNIEAEDLAVNMASSGYYECMDAATCGGQSVQNKNQVNNLLDNAAASYEGALIEFAPGEYNYMSTRNNNFSNRSQKGQLRVMRKDG